MYWRYSKGKERDPLHLCELLSVGRLDRTALHMGNSSITVRPKTNNIISCHACKLVPCQLRALMYGGTLV